MANCADVQIDFDGVDLEVNLSPTCASCHDVCIRLLNVHDSAKPAAQLAVCRVSDRLNCIWLHLLILSVA